tara:strand:- start:13654 stop:13929 length:276 start_codon:yes stop_codon:yes gene_type:complete
LLEQPLQAINIAFYFGNRAFIVFGRCHLEQIPGIPDARIQTLNRLDDALKSGSLAAEILRARLVIPDAGFGQLEFYLRETILALVEVKDTP